MKIDAHHHFWQLSRYDYTWLQKNLEVIRRDFGPEHLQPLLQRHGIDRSVLVQTINSVDETRWFLELKQQHPFIGGVVGWVNLTDPRVGDTLDELQHHPGLVGIRYQFQGWNDRQEGLPADLQRGLEHLARRRLRCDLLLRPAHLAAALKIARAVEHLPLVVDHLAKPRIAQGGWDDWAGGLADLAGCLNVCCKLSGMITEADWKTWQPKDLAPYIQHALECFGPRRVMFGSDWPVCLLAGSYDQVVQALADNLGRLSAEQRGDVFGHNAARFYGLTVEK